MEPSGSLTLNSTQDARGFTGRIRPAASKKPLTISLIALSASLHRTARATKRYNVDPSTPADARTNSRSHWTAPGSNRCSSAARVIHSTVVGTAAITHLASWDRKDVK